MAITNVPPAGNPSSANDSTKRQTRSFADLYEQAKRASGNDNQDTAANDAASRRKAEENRKYIEDLHERVDTLRGEILVRVIQSSRAKPEEKRDATQEVSRLSDRLNSLRRKLVQEEGRLSGSLVDETV